MSGNEFRIVIVLKFIDNLIVLFRHDNNDDFFFTVFVFRYYIAEDLAMKHNDFGVLLIFGIVP